MKFGIKYKFSKAHKTWHFYKWFRSKKSRNQVLSVLRQRAENISNHIYKPIRRA